jgi:hypothetical protein
VKSVITSEEDSWRRCSIRVEAKSDPREAIYRLAVDRQWVIRELALERATLEDAFVELTHKDN